ncbi:MAG: LPS assembly lipoprotein LptE [Novosphingobium sp.]|nr:LPS assembly lipoprotein LptE [Novosphingobium sp.]
MRRLAPLLLLASLALAGCGLQPMYAGGSKGEIARGLAGVEVAPIEGRAGWLVRNALRDRLSPGGDNGAAGRYILHVKLDEDLTGLGLLGDDTIGRERFALRARYQLVDAASGEVLLDATSGSDAGVDVVSSEYAVIAAEQRARENLARDIADRIVTRLALRLNAGK